MPEYNAASGADGRRPRATMADVARLAGVSTATVSRVFNDDTSVRPAKREAVLRAIATTGYQPNRVAANLRRQKAEMIGVLVSDIENPHFAEMVRAVEDGAHRNGYRVLLCNTDEQPDKQRDYLRVLAAERVGGVILSPSGPAAPEISQLLDHGTAIVAVDRAVDDPRAAAVTVRNREGARMATAHLIALGHQRIGLLAGLSGVETGDERRAGYLDALAAAQLEPAIAYGRFRVGASREATHRLLASGVTAIVAGNNLAGAGALQAVREAGVVVPDDVALVTFDDPFWAALTDPPLTALAQPVPAMAEAAVELLLERIRSPSRPPRHVVLDLELRVRESCGARQREAPTEA